MKLKRSMAWSLRLCGLLGVFDHILPDEGQHWVSPTYIARIVSGEPKIMEPGKCSAIGWFALDDLPAPLSIISTHDAKLYSQTSK